MYNKSTLKLQPTQRSLDQSYYEQQDGNQQDNSYRQGIINIHSSDNQQYKYAQSDCHQVQWDILSKRPSQDLINQNQSVSPLHSMMYLKAQSKEPHRDTTKTQQRIVSFKNKQQQTISNIISNSHLISEASLHTNANQKFKVSHTQGDAIDDSNLSNRNKLGKTKQKQNEFFYEVFTATQVQYLKLYFKYSCEKLKNSPKFTTFQDSKILCQTMNLTEWMLLCKTLSVFQFFVQARDIARTLNAIFKRCQNKQKRLQFDSFCIAFKILIETMSTFLETHNQKYDIKIIKKYLGIYSREEFQLKLQKMGVNQKIFHQLFNQKKQHKKNKFTNKKFQTKSLYEKQQTMRKAQPQRRQPLKQVQNTVLPKGIKNVKQNKQDQQKSTIKIYRKRQDRIRSRIMKNLGISNIDKLLPSDQVKQNFDNLMKQYDRFLKQYLKQKKQVKNGILKRLESKQSKYNSSSFMNNKLRINEKDKNKNKTVFDL